MTIQDQANTFIEWIKPEIEKQLANKNTKENIDIVEIFNNEFNALHENYTQRILKGLDSNIRDQFEVELPRNSLMELLDPHKKILKYIIVQQLARTYKTTLEETESKINQAKKQIENNNKNYAILNELLMKNQNEYTNLTKYLETLRNNNNQLTQQINNLEKEKQKITTLHQAYVDIAGKLEELKPDDKTIATMLGYQIAPAKNSKPAAKAPSNSWISSSSSAPIERTQTTSTSRYKLTKIFLALPKDLQKIILKEKTGLDISDDNLTTIVRIFQHAVDTSINRNRITKYPELTIEKFTDRYKKSIFIQNIIKENKEINAQDFYNLIKGQVILSQASVNALRNDQDDQLFVSQHDFIEFFSSLTEEEKSNFFSIGQSQQTNLLVLSLKQENQKDLLRLINEQNNKRQNSMSTLRTQVQDTKIVITEELQQEAITTLLEKAEVIDQSLQLEIRKLLKNGLNIKEYITTITENPLSIKMIYDDEIFIDLIKSYNNKYKEHRDFEQIGGGLYNDIQSHFNQMLGKDRNPTMVQAIQEVNKSIKEQEIPINPEDLREQYEQKHKELMQQREDNLITEEVNELLGSILEENAKEEQKHKDCISLFKQLNLNKPERTSIANRDEFIVIDIFADKSFQEILKKYRDEKKDKEALKKDLQNYLKNEIGLNNMNPFRVRAIELINDFIPQASVDKKSAIFEKLSEKDLDILKKIQERKGQLIKLKDEISQLNSNLTDKTASAYYAAYPEQFFSLLTLLSNLNKTALRNAFPKIFLNLNEETAKTLLQNFSTADKQKLDQLTSNILESSVSELAALDVQTIQNKEAGDIIKYIRTQTIESAAYRIFDKFPKKNSKNISKQEFIDLLRLNSDKAKNLLDFINQDPVNLSIIQKLLNKIFFFRKTNLAITQDLLSRNTQNQASIDINEGLIEKTIRQAELFKELNITVNDKNYKKIKFTQEILEQINQEPQPLEAQYRLSIVKGLFNDLDKFPETYNHQNIISNKINNKLSNHPRVITNTFFQEVRDDIIKNTANNLLPKEIFEAPNAQLIQYLHLNPKILLLLDELNDKQKANLKEILKLSWQHYKDVGELNDQAFPLIFSKEFLEKLTERSVIELDRLSIEKNPQMQKLIIDCLEQKMMRENIAKILQNKFGYDQSVTEDLATQLCVYNPNIDKHNISKSLLELQKTKILALISTGAKSLNDAIIEINSKATGTQQAIYQNMVINDILQPILTDKGPADQTKLDKILSLTIKLSEISKDMGKKERITSKQATDKACTATTVLNTLVFSHCSKYHQGDKYKAADMTGLLIINGFDLSKPEQINKDNIEKFIKSLENEQKNPSSTLEKATLEQLVRYTKSAEK